MSEVNTFEIVVTTGITAGKAAVYRMQVEMIDCTQTAQTFRITGGTRSMLAKRQRNGITWSWTCIESPASKNEDWKLKGTYIGFIYRAIDKAIAWVKSLRPSRANSRVAKSGNGNGG